MNGRWQQFCIVGIGGHARTKLIPAIAANGQTLSGIVSRQDRSTLPDTCLFQSIEDAVAQLPSETAFILASPPAAHAAQSEPILAAGRDLIVEKPAFVDAQEARRAVETARQSGAVLVEAFMHRHTEGWRRLRDLWAARVAEIEAINVDFVIPAMPPGTFRAEPTVASSSTYDIGCYVVSLLGDLGLAERDVSIVAVDRPNSNFEQVRFASVDDARPAITATIGVAPDYANRIELVCSGESITISPAFYGRPGDRLWATQRDGIVASETVVEQDAFQAMLARPRAAWIADQEARSAQMICAAATLNRLGRELSRFRMAVN